MPNLGQRAGRVPSRVALYHRGVVGRAKALLGAIVARGVALGEFRDGPSDTRCRNSAHRAMSRWRTRIGLVVTSVLKVPI